MQKQGSTVRHIDTGEIDDTHLIIAACCAVTFNCFCWGCHCNFKQEGRICKSIVTITDVLIKHFETFLLFNFTAMTLRRRNDLNSKTDRRSSSVCDEDKKMMSRMSSKLWRLLTPYKLLLLFIVIVFILQVIVGISFFHTVSHRFRWVGFSLRHN